MSTQNTTREIGIVMHVDPIWVTQLDPAQTYETPVGSRPYTVLNFGGFDFHFHDSEDLVRLHTLVQNAVIKQQTAEAKHRRDREGATDD